MKQILDGSRGKLDPSEEGCYVRNRIRLVFPDRPLEHVPEKWNRFPDKDRLRFIKLERVFIALVIVPKCNAL
jgi:hypothetical protein